MSCLEITIILENGNEFGENESEKRRHSRISVETKHFFNL